MAAGEISVNSNGRRRTVCLVAWEISGDQNAGRLAAAIRRLAPDIRLVGVGGRAMSEAGVEVEVHTTDTHFMGVPESFGAIGRQVAIYRRVWNFVISARPDIVVLIDNETTNLMLARWLRRHGLEVVFFFPPQVWFWGRWRISRVAGLTRRVISAFREEAELYREAGADTVWVGHPLRDEVVVSEDPNQALRAIGLDPGRPLVVIMPGSRRQEVRTLALTMLNAAQILQSRDHRLQFALPLASESLREEIEPLVRQSGLRDIVIYEPHSYAVLSRARAVLQCSGTATVETALLGVPSVVAYRCSPISYLLANCMMHVRFISIVNILFGEMVQPEFFQRNVDCHHLAEEVWSLLNDDNRRAAIQARLGRVRDLLGPSGVSLRAAQAVVDLLTPDHGAQTAAAAARELPVAASLE